MLILSLDSTAVTATVGLCDDEKLLALSTVQNGNTHSETLLPMVENVLNAFSLKPQDVGMFACSVGPGSFTGVRIGVSTIKGLTFGTGIPCVGVSTLEALAYNVIGMDGILCPVMNARRGQVYNALFRCENGVMTRLCDDRSISVQELAQALSKEESPVYLTGDGYDIAYLGLAETTRALRVTPIMLRPQNAYSVAQVALGMFRAGRATDDKTLSPIYLRPCQAERERMEKMAQKPQ